MCKFLAYCNHHLINYLHKFIDVRTYKWCVGRFVFYMYSKQRASDGSQNTGFKNCLTFYSFKKQLVITENNLCRKECCQAQIRSRYLPQQQPHINMLLSNLTLAILYVEFYAAKVVIRLISTFVFA